MKHIAVARGLFLKAALAAALFLGISAAATADVPLGTDVTVSAQGSGIVTTDPSKRRQLPSLENFLFLSWNLTPTLTFYSSAHLGVGSDQDLLGTFLRWKLGKSGVSADVGRIPLPFGTASYRNLPFRNPLLEYPIVYGYTGKTSQGASDVYPISPYPYAEGASLSWRDQHFLATIAVVNKSPGPYDAPLSAIGHNLVGRLQWTPAAAWQIGLSYASGRHHDPGGGSPYLQRMGGMDVTYASGPFQLVAEGVRSKAQTYSGLSAWYAEARYKVRPGLYLAMRHGQLDVDGVGAGRRTEAGLGYSLTPKLLLRAEYEIEHGFYASRHPFIGGISWRI